MGRRHLTGLAALYASSFCNVELAVVCDSIGGMPTSWLMRRPSCWGGARRFTDLGEMAWAMPEIQGADVPTDTGSHHIVACACLEAGLHVQCEKPLALTSVAATR